jgi:release factor glutamine methyltransferase
MTVREALAAAAARLAGVSGTPRLDAELLMAEALATSREALLLSPLDQEAPSAFAPLVERRLIHEPVAYITRRRAFWTIALEVGPGALVPRPDSETLIEAAVERFGVAGPATILDLGTGPGTLLLAALAEWPEARGLGIDSSERALAYAVRNAARLGFEARVRFGRGDWTEGVDGTFDLVLCNPPYVEDGADLPPDVREWEPAEALFAGADGLDAYRVLAPRIATLLAPRGIACFEIGAGQAAAAGDLFKSNGFDVAVRQDLGGRDRCLVLRH